jgi:hypothetical protein
MAQSKDVNKLCTIPADLLMWAKARAALDRRSANSVIVESLRKLKEATERGAST